ncbi:MAG: Flp family type IVb pilin [Hyphomonadaceae bacterium]|nr:Flp family type IVb pilin [Hyphomonadaceae bacterium]
MSKFVVRFARDETGATAIEYGLIAGLIALVLVAALTTLGPKVAGTFNKVASKMP